MEYAILFIAALIGGTYGTVFGGGSFVVLPALFLLGVDPIIAVATNKFAIVGQQIMTTTTYYRSKQINFKAVHRLAPLYALGAITGAFLLMKIDQSLIRILVSYLIIVFAALSLAYPFKDRSGLKPKLSKFKKSLAKVLMVPLGIYGSIITASTGTLMTFLLVHLSGMNFKSAISSRHAITIAGAITATIIFLWSGLVDFMILIPLILGRGLGGYIGAHFVIKRKSDLLRVLFNIAVILLAVKSLLF